MSNDVIINVLTQAIENKIIKEWHHDGFIEVEHSDSFDFKLDGKTYRVMLTEVSQY